jgi:hypothetical protein
VTNGRDLVRHVRQHTATGCSSSPARTSAIAAASVLGAIALSLTCHAQPAVEPKIVPRSFGAELTAINACVREVRAATAGSRFDAHLNTRGAMRYTGTDPEIAAFKRCMQAKGFPTEPS